LTASAVFDGLGLCLEAAEMAEAGASAEAILDRLEVVREEDAHSSLGLYDCASLA